VLLFDLVDVRISPVVTWSSAAKSLATHIWLVWSSQVSVAALAAAVCDEAGGTLTAAELAPPPHPAAARPIPARSANRSAVLRLLLPFTGVPPARALW